MSTSERLWSIFRYVCFALSLPVTIASFFACVGSMLNWAVSPFPAPSLFNTILLPIVYLLAKLQFPHADFGKLGSIYAILAVAVFQYGHMPISVFLVNLGFSLWWLMILVYHQDKHIPAE